MCKRKMTAAPASAPGNKLAGMRATSSSTASHIIPLSGPALALFGGFHAMSHVFGEAGGGFVSWGCSKDAQYRPTRLGAAAWDDPRPAPVIRDPRQRAGLCHVACRGKNSEPCQRGEGQRGQ